VGPPRIFFLILDLKIANCGAFLVQFFAVQLVALHAKSSAYERIEQKAAKQGYWKLYTLCLKKKQDTKLLPITSPNVNRFSKFFHW